MPAIESGARGAITGWDSRWWRYELGSLAKKSAQSPSEISELIESSQKERAQSVENIETSTTIGLRA